MKNFLKYAIPLFTILIIGIIGFFLFSPITGSGIEPAIIASSQGCSIKYQPKVKKYNTYPSFCIDSKKKYEADIHTKEGIITMELFAKDVPKTVNNFIFLSRAGFYDNLIFHRIIPDFIIQTGDPLGNGKGNPGYTFSDEINAKDLGLNKDEILSNEAAGYHYLTNISSRKITKGIVALANAGANTNGSQFFISLSDQPNLDGRYTPFGMITSGLDVAISIAAQDRDSLDKPLTKIIIDSIKIKEM